MSKQIPDSNESKNQESSKVSSTMQMDDLVLDEVETGDIEEKLDEVSELLEQGNELDGELDAEGTDPLEHVEAISQRIQDLSLSLQRSGSSCDCHETADRMIELDARLAKLQNDLNRQAGRGEKLESGLQLIKAFGAQIESLTSHVKLSTNKEDQVDYTENFADLDGELKSIRKQLEEQPNIASDFAKQAEAIAEVDLRIEELIERSKQTEPFDELARKLDSVNENVARTEPLDYLGHKLDAMTAAIPGADQFENIGQRLNEIVAGIEKTEQLDVLVDKIDSLASHVEKDEKLESLERKLESLNGSIQKIEQLDDLGQKIESLGDIVGQSDQFEAIGSQLNLLNESLQENEKIDSVIKQVESLTDFVKLGALENEHFDASQINGMAEQITAIGQMLVEKNDSSNGNVLNEQIEQFNTKVESLVDLVQQNADSAGDGDNGSNLSTRVDELANKMDSVADLLEKRSESPGTFDGEIPDYSDKIQALSEKVEETQAMVNSLVNSLAPLVQNMIPNGGADDDEAGPGDWEQQKRAMLKGYGMDVADPADSPDIEGASSGNSEAQASGDAPIQEISTPELDELRTELEEKLRQAEIDISIERAKIHQERRELEEIQSELDRKQAKINTHGSNSGSDEGNEDGESPGRWSRFLGN